MIRKLLLLPLLSVLLSAVCIPHASAQYLPPRMSIHLTNPLSLVSKFGVRFQYRLNERHSFVAGYRSYYAFFPGYQASIGYHHYYRTWEKSEAFYYGKFGIGKADYSSKKYFGYYGQPFDAPGAYGFIGAGLGKRYNFGPFFIEGNVGLKYTEVVDKKLIINRNMFYTTGPGSLVDCGIHLGLQFFSEGRHMYYKTLAPRKRSRYSN